MKNDDEILNPLILNIFEINVLEHFLFKMYNYERTYSYMDMIHSYNGKSDVLNFFKMILDDNNTIVFAKSDYTINQYGYKPCSNKFHIRTYLRQNKIGNIMSDEVINPYKFNSLEYVENKKFKYFYLMKLENNEELQSLVKLLKPLNSRYTNSIHNIEFQIYSKLKNN